MTSAPRSLLRSLDAVDAPDQWDDIVRRARDGDGGGALVTPLPVEVPGRSRRPLAVAAVVLVIAALAAALVLRPGGGSERAGNADQIWGHRWQLSRIDAGGGSVTTDLTGPEGPIVLDTRTWGEFQIQPCNNVHGKAALEGDRFVMSEAFSTMAGCIDPLESLIDLDGARVAVDGDRLTMSRSKEPAATYTFIRTDALTPTEAFWGRHWRVTSGADASGGEWKEDPGDGPIIDATRAGRLQIDTCQQVGADASIDGDRIELDGTWETLRMGYCQQRSMDDVIRGIFTHPDATVGVDGERFAVRSSGGVVRGVMTGVPVQGPAALFGHRWAVVAVLERDDPVAVPADYVLTATDRPRSISVPGCPTDYGGGAAVAEDGMVTIVDPIPGAVGSCTSVDPDVLDIAAWFRTFFTAPFEVAVLGERALLRQQGRQVALVRLD